LVKVVVAGVLALSVVIGAICPRAYSDDGTVTNRPAHVVVVPTDGATTRPQTTSAMAVAGTVSVSVASVVAAEAGSMEFPAAETWGRADTLAEHFGRHGADFGAPTEEVYAQQASDFFQRGLQDELPTKIDPKTAAIRINDTDTNSFGAYNANGTTRTFYKPDPSIHRYATKWDYWQAQPGYSPWGP
jgi:hypothetical protein